MFIKEHGYNSAKYSKVSEQIALASNIAFF